QEVSEIFSSAFLAKKTSIKLTGYPRNDSFFMPHDTSFPLAQQLQLLKKEQCSIGIYMPTHRQEGKSEIFSLFYSALPQLNKTLKQLNTALFVKLHFYHNQSTGTEQTVSFSNIFFIKDEDINQDIYNLLPYTDFLITDYSSIYFDYLLTDKPIIFTPFDIQEYITKDRTFYFDYTAVTPGPKASDWNEVSEYIKKFKQTPSFFSKERSALCARFNKYCEGKACQRVYFEVMKFLYPNHNEK
ncbi:CDP-glycerol glycerophosphotransferase family protein, partial [bacterium]|nr:CDP-glycerol glycerophosphotransferase family protein [bacterium]